MKLSEAPVCQRVIATEKMDGDEIRLTHFLRLDGEATFNSNPSKPTAFVRAAFLRTTQGVAGETPRYDSGEIYNICDVDGRITVSTIPKP